MATLVSACAAPLPRTCGSVLRHFLARARRCSKPHAHVSGSRDGGVSVGKINWPRFFALPTHLCLVHNYVMPFSHFFVSKHRKVEFQISITIHELSKVPLVSGLYHVKWRIKNAHRSSGSTERAPIKDHCICWDYSLSTTAEIITNRENTLQPCDLKLEVFREEGDGRTESIGWLSLDLSEDAGAAISTQLYLLEESKFNSIFKLSINVSQKTQSPVKFNTPERRKKRFLADIPSMIIESKERSMVFDERSLKDASERSRKGAAPSIKKSYSSMSLPHYCRQNNPGEPSPSDLVEQLFMNPKVHTSP